MNKTKLSFISVLVFLASSISSFAKGLPQEYYQIQNTKKSKAYFFDYIYKLNEQENIKIIERIGTPIKQLFNIAVGIATLKDEVFFVDSVNAKNGFLTKTTENGTFLIEKEITRPVYKISKFKWKGIYPKNK